MSSLWLMVSWLGTAAAMDDIINGEDASLSDYPMTGGLLVGMEVAFGGQRGEARTLLCSSTLIAPDVVLLAAHCIDEGSLSDYVGMPVENVVWAWSRKSDLSAVSAEQLDAPWPDDTAFAWDTVMHPDYMLTSLGLGLSLNYDIGLMFLEEPLLDVPLGYVIQAGEVGSIVVDASVDVVGWGQQTSDARPPEGTIGFKVVGESFINQLADYEFQVGDLSTDVRKCHGDSGGPTFLEVNTTLDNRTRVIGVASHTFDQTDCRETGAVETRVDYYLDWIDTEMRSRCEDDTRSWCEVAGIVPPTWPGDQDADGAFSDGDTKLVGCGCSSTRTPSGTGWMLGSLLALLAWVRRTR